MKRKRHILRVCVCRLVASRHFARERHLEYLSGVVVVVSVFAAREDEPTNHLCLCERRRHRRELIEKLLSQIKLEGHCARARSATKIYFNFALFSLHVPLLCSPSLWNASVR